MYFSVFSVFFFEKTYNFFDFFSFLGIGRIATGNGAASKSESRSRGGSRS